MTNSNDDTSFHLIGMPRVVDEHGLRSREPFEVLATQFVDELRKGLRPSPELYARRYPPHAERIREYFPLLTLLEQARIENEASLFRHNMPEKFPFRQLGGCELLCELGRGGMGVVFQGMNVESGHIVAVKVLPWRVSIVPEWMQKFHREARIASQIRHPNIVPVFQCGEEHGYIFYTMKFVNGVGLDRIIIRLQHTTEVIFAEEIRLMHRSRPPGFVVPPEVLATEEHPVDHDGDRSNSMARPESARRQLSRYSWVGFARIAIQTAQALRSAHALGIIHNDIKPGNLLVDETGHVWVTDFGLSQPFDPVSVTPLTTLQQTAGRPLSAQLKSTAGLYGMRQSAAEPITNHDNEERLAGTLRYMAPERLLGFPPDVRSDVYSLGITLYELSLQRAGFQISDREKLLDAILDSAPPLPTCIRPEFPRDLEIIILNCIARNPEDRYSSADAVLTDLLRYCSEQSVASTRQSRMGGVIRSLKQRFLGRDSDSR